MKKKTVALLLALVLVFGVAAGGTLAWLTAKSETVTNTFTASDINVELTETGATNNENSYKMIPGYTITKDPEAKVLAGSEECYLFVKLEKSTNFSSFMTYEMADGWTELTGVDGVYYRVVTKDGRDNTSKINESYSVLKGDQVTVLGTVTKADMNGLTAANYPTLKVTAYASQLYKNNTETFTPTEAWANVNA